MADPSFRQVCLMLGVAFRPTPTPTRKRGRPPTSPEVKAFRAAIGPSLLFDGPLPKQRGAPTKLTPELKEWFLADIDRVKALAARRGKKVSDRVALRARIFFYRKKKYLKDGRSDAEATRLATAAASGPWFHTRKSTLARLRRQASKTRR